MINYGTNPRIMPHYSGGGGPYSWRAVYHLVFVVGPNVFIDLFFLLPKHITKNIYSEFICLLAGYKGKSNLRYVYSPIRPLV